MVQLLYGCVESVEREKAMWKRFFGLFLSRLASLSSQVDASLGHVVAYVLCEVGRLPKLFPCPEQQLLVFS